MGSLKRREVKQLLIEFKATQGFFLDLTNNEFEELFENTLDIEIYDDKYSLRGNSKANRFQEFLRLESDELINKLLEQLRK